MSALTEFLSSRLAEDIAAVKEAAGGEASATPDFTVTGWPACEYPGRVVVVGLERFVADIEAKAAIVKRHTDEDYGTFEGLGEVTMCRECRDQRGPCFTVRALASAYADHPDYDETWRA